MNEEFYIFLAMALERKLSSVKNTFDKIYNRMYDYITDKKLYFYCQNEFSELTKTFNHIQEVLDNLKNTISVRNDMSLQEFDNLLEYLQTTYRNTRYNQTLRELKAEHDIVKPKIRL